MEQVDLIKIINVDKELCVNCHACISACPVKLCNDGSGEYVTVNQNMCLGCGNCLKICSHNARTFIDDFQQLFSDLKSGEKIIAITAPSIASNFPEKYLQINGWFKSIGVKGVFDVSFGAELTVKSYLDFIEKNNPQTIIAQPCAAIVTYIQIYQPELIPYLAPADSPMLHTMKMIREFYPEYNDYKIAVISPCNAKKREYIETGFGDYNVAYKSIANYIEENNIDLNNFEETDYINPPAERAILFSSPGGLMQTAERWMPEIRHKTRKIEGSHIIYDYLKKLPTLIDEKKSPLLIDCLNCDNGCNAGPLTLNKDKTIDEIEYWIYKRNQEVQEKFLANNRNSLYFSRSKIEETINRYWKENLYSRTYKNLRANNLTKIPDKLKIKEIYFRMHKYSEKDVFNCTSCGYGTCEQMAIAIHNNLNRVENCHFYLFKETEISHQNIIKSQKRLSTILSTTVEGFFQIDVDGKIVDANKAMLELVETDKVIGKHINDFLDPENQKILAEQRKLREKNKNSVYEITITSAKGKKIFCNISGTVLRDEENNRIGSFAMVSDITEFKKTQEDLHNLNTNLEEIVEHRTAELNDTMEELKSSSEKILQYNIELQKLSIVASNTNNAVIIMDNDGNLNWVNKSFYDVYGYNLEEFIHKFGKNIRKASSSTEIVKLLDKCNKTMSSVTYETKNYTKNNKVIWTQTNLTPIIENDEIVSYIAIESDITEMKLAHEEILNQREEILNQREELLAQRDEILETSKRLKDSFDELKTSEKKLQIYNKEVLRQKEEITKKSMELDEKIEELKVTADIIDATNIELEQKHDEIEEKNQLLEKNQKNILLKNKELQQHKEEILSFNELLTSQQKQILKANEILEIQKKEILDQKNELVAQRDIVTENRDKIARQNKEITDSIEYAKRIQEALFSSDKNLNLKDYFVFFKPKDIVSGDFFWMKRFLNYTLIAVGDCTGHGVPGAFMSMLGITLLNEISNKYFRKLSKIQIQANYFLNDLRENIIKVLHQDKTSSSKDGMDIAFCILDNDTKIVQYSGAYNPLLIIRNGQIIEIKADKMPIGIHLGKMPDFTNKEAQLFENDKIYMFTDGVIDQFGGLQKRKFLKNRFLELLLQIEQRLMDEQRYLLDQVMVFWRQDEKQTDDMLIVGIQI
jgi:PAS domain S-box-containing protein